MVERDQQALSMKAVPNKLKFLIPKVELFWHGVVATTAPRMAAEDAARAEIETFEGTVFLDGFQHILAASRGEAARRRSEGADGLLIETNGESEKVL